MNDIELITTNFRLTEHQIHQFRQLSSLYQNWNSQINVISRRDIGNLYLRHVLHSLSIAKVIQFKAGANILDLGTGGGFPGIPLAILFPEVNFLLIDGTRKKIKVVEEISRGLGLENVHPRQIRVEELKGVKFDFVVTRAVASLEKLILWSRRLIKSDHQHAIPNGLIALKGGKLDEEMKALYSRGDYIEKYNISDFFENAYFDEKYVVYIQT